MILDYVRWRSDLTFEEREFNNIDALVIARISYMYFDEVFKENEKELNISEVLKRYVNTKNIEQKTMWLPDIELAKLLMKSKRYMNLVVSDYLNVIDNTKEKQFAALTITVNEKTKIVSFRGTDNTVIGWKEDFNLSFEDNIPAQRSSVKYLNRIMEESKGNIITIGHSKGGNLAIYSSIFIDDKYRDRIKSIYNFDGPGFNSKILNDKRYLEITDRIKTFIPEDAIVGIIMNRNENYMVVKSSADSIMQHDIYSWELEISDFKYLENLSKNSILLGKSIASWLNNIDIDERKKFVDLLFDGLTESSLNLNEIGKNISLIGKVLYKSITEPDIRDMLSKTIKIIYDVYISQKENNTKNI